MIGLHKIIELREKSKLGFYETMDKRADGFLLSCVDYYSSNAVCFHMGDVDDWEGIDNFSYPSIILPYPVCWFELDVNVEEKYCKPGGFKGVHSFGFLCWNDEKLNRIEMVAFLKKPTLDWMVWGYCFEKEKTKNNIIFGFLDCGGTYKDWLLSVLPYLKFFLSALNCTNVERIENIPPEKLQKKRARSGKLPLFSYWTLHLKLPKDQTKKEYNGAGSHRSPRLHLRRGHIREYSPGKYTWVQPCVVGKKENGIIHKDYAKKKRMKKNNV